MWYCGSYRHQPPRKEPTMSTSTAAADNAAAFKNKLATVRTRRTEGDDVFARIKAGEIVSPAEIAAAVAARKAAGGLR